MLSSHGDSGWLQGCKLDLWPKQLFSQSPEGLQNVSVFKRLWSPLPASCHSPAYRSALRRLLFLLKCSGLQSSCTGNKTRPPRSLLISTAGGMQSIHNMPLVIPSPPLTPGQLKGHPDKAGLSSEQLIVLFWDGQRKGLQPGLCDEITWPGAMSKGWEGGEELWKDDTERVNCKKRSCWVTDHRGDGYSAKFCTHIPILMKPRCPECLIRRSFLHNGGLSGKASTNSKGPNLLGDKMS